LGEDFDRPNLGIDLMGQIQAQASARLVPGTDWMEYIHLVVSVLLGSERLASTGIVAAETHTVVQVAG